MQNESTLALIGLTGTMSLATSALPDAPVVPDIPHESLLGRARRAVVATRRLVSRPAPALADEPAVAPS